MLSSTSTLLKRGALIVGAGEGIGKSLVSAFKEEGYITGASRRTRGGLDFMDNNTLDHKYDGFDARSESQVRDMFSSFSSHCEGNIEVCVFNIGANINFPIMETTARKFQKCWEMACLSGFLVGREAATCMSSNNPSGKGGKGTIIFTGATASLRGGEIGRESDRARIEAASHQGL